MAVNRVDLLAGAIFSVIGAAFAAYAWRYLDLGTPFRMGPGFFPVLLGLLLTALGLGIAGGGLFGRPTAIGALPWRAMLLLTLSPIVFGMTIRSLGLAPATALAVVIAAFASPTITPARAVVVTLALTAFCCLIFVVALGQPLPLFGP